MAGPGLEDAGRHATEGRLAESHRDREVAEEPRRRRHPEGVRESLLQDDAESPGSVSFRVVPAESTTYPDLFRIPTFPRLASSVVLARTANAMMQLALVLFTLQRFHSPTLAGVTVFLAIAPGIAVSPIAGALLDRHGRVRLIMLDYAVGALSLFLIAGLDAAGRANRRVRTAGRVAQLRCVLRSRRPGDGRAFGAGGARGDDVGAGRRPGRAAVCGRPKRIAARFGHRHRTGECRLWHPDRGAARHDL